jgi:hypothetical protein
MIEPPGTQRTALQPPDEITHGLFVRGRYLVRTHPLVTDTLLALVLLVVCSVWLAGTKVGHWHAALLQTALILALVPRRLWPSGVFLFMCALAFVQWLFLRPLLGDVALLVALYTVAAHQSWIRALLATVLMEAGAVMAPRPDRCCS